jgi:hypothetical protein
MNWPVSLEVGPSQAFLWQLENRKKFLDWISNYLAARLDTHCIFIIPASVTPHLLYNQPIAINTVLQKFAIPYT